MQLVTDFIPNSIIYDVVKPYIYISSVLVFANIIAFLLFFLKKYLPVIILGSIAFYIHGAYIFLN